jgi:hypothetical protein
MKNQINSNNQKLSLQKKTIKKLSSANMIQIQGGVKAAAPRNTVNTSFN